MGCSETEWKLNEERFRRWRVWLPFGPRFQLFPQPGCNFSLFLSCLFKCYLDFKSQHIHHWCLSVRFGFVSPAAKRILSKIKGFPEELKFELSLKDLCILSFGFCSKLQLPKKMTQIIFQLSFCTFKKLK